VTGHLQTSKVPGPDSPSHGPPQPVGDRTVVILRLLGGAVGLWALLSLTGLLFTHLLGSGRFHRWDLGVDRWLVTHRTPTWNTVTVFGSGVANTQTAIAVTVVAVLFLRWRLHRWYEAWVVVAAIAGELVIFLAVTATVHRPRPPVPRLDVSPPTSSFPSGHTAAALALYGCLAVLLLGVYGRRRPTELAALVLFAVSVAVGISRLYRGMHYPSDVLVGALGGGLWLLVVVTTLLSRPSRTGPHPNGVESGRGSEQ
jgi:membrane-associated phospholipid phosphatase